MKKFMFLVFLFISVVYSNESMSEERKSKEDRFLEYVDNQIQLNLHGDNKSYLLCTTILNLENPRELLREHLQDNGFRVIDSLALKKFLDEESSRDLERRFDRVANDIRPTYTGATFSLRESSYSKTLNKMLSDEEIKPVCFRIMKEEQL